MRRKYILGAVLLLVLSLFVSACASAKNTSMPQEAGAAAPAASAAAAKSDGIHVTFSESIAQNDAYVSEEKPKGFNDYEAADTTVRADKIPNDRKIIKDGNVSMETSGFDKSISLMDELIEAVGGFTEQRLIRGKSSYSYGLRSAEYVIRVPAERFDSVLKEMGNLGTVLETNSKGTDITDQYYDSETRIKTLKVQEQTLLDILAKATKLEDVITLESRISEVRYEIEKLENTLKNYDRLVAFSRIAISIMEVDDKTETKPVPKTLSERVSGSFSRSIEDFKNGLEDFLVWLAGSWITLIFLTAVGFIAYFWYRKKRKKLMPKKVEVIETKTENKE